MAGRDDSDKVLLIRKHNHLIKPLRNDSISRKRQFSNSTVTVFILGACFFTGYAYGRLKNDEVLRRLFYCRYANFMTWFDSVSPPLEAWLIASFDSFNNFDSTYAVWYFKTSKLA